MFLGSVFSPRYAKARALGAADPLDHAAVNLCLYDRRHAWAFNERPRQAVSRGPDHLAVGPTRLVWEGDTLVLAFDETRAPFGGRLAGTVRLHPEARFAGAVALDPAARHLWHPVAPVARAEVDLSAPALRFTGSAYHDLNLGTRALEADLDGWRWQRRRLASGRTAVVYDTLPREGAPRLFAATFDPRRGIATPRAAPVSRLPPSAWGLDRSQRVDADRPARLVRTLEDTPFYARSLLAVDGAGDRGPVVAETVDLARFRARWVRFLLGFRMRREAA